MAFKLHKKDCDMLSTIAEHRILMMDQIALLTQRSKHSIYRRIRCLEKEGFIRTTKKCVNNSAGRPKTLMDLTDKGIDALREKEILDHNIPYENVNAQNINCLGHQMLMNLFRIYFNYAEQVLPTVSVRFLAHNSPFVQRDQFGRVFISDYAPVFDSDVGEVVRFVPDGVLSITDSAQDLTILLFLEVDCGTETLASPRRDMTDIRQKIINYQSYFLNERYKRYEHPWKCKLRGFHLLFLTNTIGRLASLCRLVRDMGEEETCFIYLTEQSRLSEGGVTADIWAKGGNLHAPQTSIFGSLSCSAPLPNKF